MPLAKYVCNVTTDLKLEIKNSFFIYEGYLS